MVDLVARAVCGQEYCRIFDRADAVRDSRRALRVPVLGIQTLIRYFSGHAIEGFTTVILLILIIGSVIMISLGIIGYYIAKIYEEVKGRPRYLIAKTIRAGKAEPEGRTKTSGKEEIQEGEGLKKCGK